MDKYKYSLIIALVGVAAFASCRQNEFVWNGGDSGNSSVVGTWLLLDHDAVGITLLADPQTKLLDKLNAAPESSARDDDPAKRPQNELYVNTPPSRQVTGSLITFGSQGLVVYDGIAYGRFFPELLDESVIDRTRGDKKRIILLGRYKFSSYKFSNCDGCVSVKWERVVDPDSLETTPVLIESSHVLHYYAHIGGDELVFTEPDPDVCYVRFVKR